METTPKEPGAVLVLLGYLRLLVALFEQKQTMKTEQTNEAPQPKCPECGSEDIGKGHHESFAFGECYFDRCSECEHQWGHG